MNSRTFCPGDPTKSPQCELGGPGSLKSERLSSDSNDILDPQTGLRGSSGSMQVNNIVFMSYLQEALRLSLLLRKIVN